MRKFKADAATAKRFVRALVVGPSGSGKTHFAATMPKPLIIASAVEGGAETVTGMDRTMWWDPKVAPEVWELGSVFADIPGALNDLEVMVRSGKFPFESLAFDPISVYVDGLVGELEARHKGGNKSGDADGRQVWGDVASHLLMLIQRIHALPCHVLWLSHVKSNDEDGSIAIGGQMAEKFPAYCGFKWYTNVITAPGAATKFELRTQPYKKFKFLGSRRGATALPDPMIPSFKCVAELLGLPEKPVSPSVPGHPDGVTYLEKAAPVVPIATARPPLRPPVRTVARR